MGETKWFNEVGIAVRYGLVCFTLLPAFFFALAGFMDYLSALTSWAQAGFDASYADIAWLHEHRWVPENHPVSYRLFWGTGLGVFGWVGCVGWRLFGEEWPCVTRSFSRSRS